MSRDALFIVAAQQPNRSWRQFVFIGEEQTALDIAALLRQLAIDARVFSTSVAEEWESVQFSGGNDLFEAWLAGAWRAGHPQP